MQGQFLPETFVFRILGWIGPDHNREHFLYESAEYPTLEACYTMAKEFRDRKPPFFRAHQEPRNIYVVSANNSAPSLHWICKA